MFFIERWKMALSLAAMFVLGVMAGASLSADTTTVYAAGQRQSPGHVHGKRSQGPEIYELWRGSPHAPMSLKVHGDCLENEDTAAHLKLLEFDGSETVLTCFHGGY